MALKPYWHKRHETRTNAGRGSWKRIKAEGREQAYDGIHDNLGGGTGYSGAWKIIIAMLILNVGIFCLNLYVSNHWLYGQPLSLKLLREIGFSLFWIPNGYYSPSELLLYGLDYDLGAESFGIITDAVMNGEVYRLFTYMLFHAGIIHLVSNMFALIYISLMHFTRYGKREYFTWYLAGGLGGGLATLAWAAITGTNVMSVGASSAIFGLLSGSLAPIVYAVVMVKGKGGSFRAADDCMMTLPLSPSAVLSKISLTTGAVFSSSI